MGLGARKFLKDNDWVVDEEGVAEVRAEWDKLENHVLGPNGEKEIKNTTGKQIPSTLIPLSERILQKLEGARKAMGLRHNPFLHEEVYA